CLLAADGALLLGRLRATRTPQLLLGGVLIAGTGWLTLREPREYVRGYEEAAAYVVENNRQTPVCLFDEFLGGNFIYQVRRHDPARRLGVLRGDKLFYVVLSEPHGGYEELAGGEADILDLI